MSIASRATSMTSSDLETDRLRLTVITVERMRADAAADGTLAMLLNATVPAAWPPEHWEPHVFEFIEKQARETPHAASWNRYVLLKINPPTLIGTLGGFPKGTDEAEIGYSILPTWQRQGLATEALRIFIEELFLDRTLSSITAQTLPHLMPSIRVLEKCGFHLEGPGEEGAIRYRQMKPKGDHRTALRSASQPSRPAASSAARSILTIPIIACIALG